MPEPNTALCRQKQKMAFGLLWAAHLADLDLKNYNAHHEHVTN